ncbi:MAG: nicotinate-nucleotide adenylyltransferase [Dehalococcoidales bacterium]|nr:nicotinate-nucleotide adenylyltransferase [Dehalococcoidales bacterium]
MKIGVLGGTFDPIHLGHIMIAEEARQSLSLEKVILIPAGRPIFKTHRRLTPPEHRLKMVKLAAARQKYMTVYDMEIRRRGPSYTVDTLAELREQKGQQDEIYFIIGWDNLAELPKWREPERIIEMCRLAAVPRPGVPKPDLEELENRVPGIKRRTVLLEKPWTDISATDIRQRVAGGKSIDGMVPAPVAEYIKKHGLYLKS